MNSITKHIQNAIIALHNLSFYDDCQLNTWLKYDNWKKKWNRQIPNEALVCFWWNKQSVMNFTITHFRLSTTTHDKESLSYLLLEVVLDLSALKLFVPEVLLAVSVWER